MDLSIYTTSAVKCFKQCRRRFYLEYVKGLKPISIPGALHVGTMYHKGVELLLKGESLENINAVIEKMQRDHCQEEGVDFSFEDMVTAQTMVKYFSLNTSWRAWKPVLIEKEFEVLTGYNKRLAGKIDLVIETSDKKRYLVEHKTTSIWRDGSEYINHLYVDDQNLNYLYAYQRMLEDGVITGRQLSGILYIVCEKANFTRYKATPAEERKYTRQGVLYASQREEDEDEESYRYRVEKHYKYNQRVHEVFIRRTPEELDAAMKDFNATIKDIVSCDKAESYYRNSNACNLLPCPYASKCLVDDESTDCLFRQKEKLNEELKEKGK